MGILAVFFFLVVAKEIKLRFLFQKVLVQNLLISKRLDFSFHNYYPHYIICALFFSKFVVEVSSVYILPFRTPFVEFHRTCCRCCCSYFSYLVLLLLIVGFSINVVLCCVVLLSLSWRSIRNNLSTFRCCWWWWLLPQLNGGNLLIP